MTNGHTFQVLSRTNDVNGNPYRLVLVYQGGTVIEAHEARSSRPNIVGMLRRVASELPQFSLSPREYNATRKTYRAVLKLAD